MDDVDILELIKQTENPYCYYLYAAYLEGKMEHLHYGYFDLGNETLLQAQEKLTQLVKSQIPPTTRRILDSGCGVCRTMCDLTSSGYDVTGISPQHNVLQVARKTYPAIADKIVTARYQNFRSEKKFDLILFQESSQYINAFSIFRNAAKLLDAGGHILICDEVRYSSDVKLAFNSKDEMLFFAAMFGFGLLYNRDITEKVLPSRKILVSIFNNRRNEFKAQFAATRVDFEREFSQLAAGWESETEIFGKGLYGYEVFLFKKLDRKVRHGPVEFLKIFELYMRKIKRQIAG